MLEQSKQSGSQAREQARESAQKQADVAKEQLGRLAFEALEEYFPEQAKARQRQTGAKMLVVGIAVGFLLRALLDRSR